MSVTWTAEELASFLDEVPSGIGVWDPELRCEYLNRAARMAIGTTEDPHGRHLRELVPSSMYQAAVDRVQRAAAGERQEFIRILADTDGRQTYLDMAYLPLPGIDGGDKHSVVAIGDDASADVAAEVLRRDIAPYITAVRERERVADQLEHQLTTHLTALSLDLVELGLKDAALGEALQQAAQLTDAALQQLRSSIHNKGRVGTGAQFADAVDRVLRDTTVALGFAPAFALRGPVDGIGSPLAGEILAVLREGLSNVARHARATQIVAAVAVTRSDVTVTIADNGHGIGDAQPGGGMVNLQSRAKRCGGTCTWASPGTSGTMLEWRVPLPGAAREAAVQPPDTSPRDDLPEPASPSSTPVHLPAERLLAVLDVLPVVVGVWDADARNVFANRACVEWFGRERREEIVGRLVSELASKEILVGSQPFIRAVLDGTPQHFERETTDGHGASKHIRAFFVPRIVDGRPGGFVAQIFDVTERVRKQRDLRRSVEQMTALEERRRIAEDLHDLVIQHLFAAGLRLDAARASGVESPVLDQAVTRVDAAIARLRESIVGLRRTPTPL